MYCSKDEAATYVNIHESAKLLDMGGNDGTRGVDHMSGEISQYANREVFDVGVQSTVHICTPFVWTVSLNLLSGEP